MKKNPHIWSKRLLVAASIFPVQSTTTFASIDKEGSRQLDPRHDGGTAQILSIEDFGAIPDSDFGVKEPTFPEFFSTSSGTGTRSHGVAHTARRFKDSSTNLTELSLKNTAAFNKALAVAQSGMVVLVPDGKIFTFTGGIVGQNLDGVTIDFAGSSHFVHDLKVWPFYNGTGHGYLPCINIVDSRNVTLTSSSKERARAVVDYRKNEVYLDRKGGGSGGIINGNGKVWWNDAIFGRLPGKDGDTRPRLIHVQSSADILVENLTLLNSPFWTLTVESVRAEIRHINVLVDRKYQANLLGSLHDKKNNESQLMERSDALEKIPVPSIPDWVTRKFHQPQDLNTDGIDPIGTDIWVHDCIIQNADDSVAVKPPINGNETTALNGTLSYKCTHNITVENMVLTGFGASIGSVGPREDHLCVDSVVFRNISMPGTGKGIYIKSNHDDCKNGRSSQITNILYEDVHMNSPFWWPIWIGPQQQHEPNTGLEGNCPLMYPLPGSRVCPTQGCAAFANITLRNIRINYPSLSPGVVLGNATNPIQNLVFENVKVVNSKWKPFYGRWPFHDKHYPYRGNYQCLYAQGTCRNCQPVPECLDIIN